MPLVAGVATACGPATSPPAAVPSASSPTARSPCPGDPEGSDPLWTLSTTTYDPAYTRHAFVGNGHFGQRVPPAGMGYVATGEKSGWPLYSPRYDGAFVAGLYAQEPQLRRNRQVIAAVPNLTTLTVTVGRETYAGSPNQARISRYRQSLFLRCGLLRTSVTWTTTDGRSTDLVYDLIASRGDEQVAAIRLTMTPRWSGRATVTDVIDGDGARRIVPTGGGAAGHTMHVAFTTSTTQIPGAVASTLRAGVNVQPRTAVSGRIDGLTARQAIAFPVRDGQTYTIVKYVGVDTGLTSDAPGRTAVEASRRAARSGWDQLLSDHARAWRTLWASDIVVAGQPDLQRWLRAALYSLLASARRGQDTSVAPAGLSSDNYAGLIFWDAEIWMYPGLLLLHPEIASWSMPD